MISHKPHAKAAMQQSERHKVMHVNRKDQMKRSLIFIFSINKTEPFISRALTLGI